MEFTTDTYDEAISRAHNAESLAYQKVHRGERHYHIWYKKAMLLDRLLARFEREHPK